MKSVHSCREETLWQTFCPTSCSRCIFKNSDSCRHRVCDFMRLHAIAHAIACDRCDIAHKRLSLTKNLFQRPSDASFWHYLSPVQMLCSPISQPTTSATAAAAAKRRDREAPSSARCCAPRSSSSCRGSSPAPS